MSVAVKNGDGSDRAGIPCGAAPRREATGGTVNHRPGSGLILASSLLVLAIAGGMATVGWASPQAKTVVAVYPPWWTQAQVWSAALSVGEVADVGRSRFVLVIHSTTSSASDRAMRSGAFFTFDPGALGLCRSTAQDTAP